MIFFEIRQLQLKHEKTVEFPDPLNTYCTGRKSHNMHMAVQLCDLNWSQILQGLKSAALQLQLNTACRSATMPTYSAGNFLFLIDLVSSEMYSCSTLPTVVIDSDCMKYLHCTTIVQYSSYS